MKAWINFAILEGENLPVGDHNGLSDPYVTVDHYPSKKRLLKTSVKPATLNPKWDEVYPVEVDIDEHSAFHFSVKDKDFIGCDHLCYLVIQAKTLLRTGLIDDWLPLTKKLNQLADVGYGRLHVRITMPDYTPPDSAPSARGSASSMGPVYSAADRRVSAMSTGTSSDAEKRFLYAKEQDRTRSVIAELDDNVLEK